MSNVRLSLMKDVVNRMDRQVMGLTISPEELDFVIAELTKRISRNVHNGIKVVVNGEERW